MSLIRIKNYIAGTLVDPVSGNWIPNAEPATGQVYSEVPDSGSQDVANAVDAAAVALETWSRAPVDERIAVLHRLADLIDQNREELVALESQDNGKPESLARMIDIPRCSKNIRFFANLAMGAASESHAMPDAINYTLRQPVGIVTCISPWNLPLYLFTWKIAPALATGNCVIGKPSEVTPMSAYRFSELCIEAGMPDGVMNIVHGSGNVTGNALLEEPRISAVSFTGSTATGQHIARVVSPQFKKLSLELGGKNPNLVFADCHYESMLETTLKSSFANQGQICLCGSRILVERSIYQRFRDDLVERAKQIKVGDPREPDSILGAMVSQAHYQKVLDCIERARSEGGKVLCGGSPAKVGGRCQEGWFIEPTVIEGLPNDCQTNQREIFGPVVTLQPFDSDHEALELANATRYGLSATVWTQDVSRANWMADRLQCGVVWVNCWLIRDLRTPFGGYKQSGVGREGGLEAMRFFTETKNVCIKYL
ncbi:MAG: aldehyde dehydrogenase [Planctomycetota bacterium]|nr:aldehyde dehydrogenase [Planctomycetota bacterium]